MSKRSMGEEDIQFQIKMIEQMSKRADEKDFLELEQDIFAFTVLCLFKANRRKFHLTSEKQASLIHSTIIVITLQFGLAYCMFEYIVDSLKDKSVAFDLFN